MLSALAPITPGAIVACLAETPRAVDEPADELSISRPAVSQHLKVLKDAGLVVDAPIAPAFAVFTTRRIGFANRSTTAECAHIDRPRRGGRTKSTGPSERVSTSPSNPSPTPGPA